MKKKILRIVGQALFYIALYVGSIAFGMWAFLQNTIY